MPDIQFKGVPAQEAIDNIRRKVRVPTERWDQMLGEAHAKAFTVAGAIKADLLKDLHKDVTQAIENGESIGQFRKRFAETVHQHGWSYKGDPGWRTRVIYDTNMRTAHMAGRWKQIEQNKTQRPYLIYMTVRDERVRETHRSWHRLALKVDDPFWSTHYPPNGWGCRCYVISATEKQIEKMGIEVASNPGIQKTERINTKTGEVYGDVPVGIDTGWDYNVGKAWLGPDAAFGEKLMQLPASLRTPASADIFNATVNQTKSWQSWLTQIAAAPKANGYSHTAGFLQTDVISALAKTNIVPKNAAIIAPAEQLTDLIDKDWIQLLPNRLANYKAALLHKPTQRLVFVLPDNIEKTNRAIAEVEISANGQNANTVKVLKTESIKTLRQNDYELIAGEL